MALFSARKATLFVGPQGPEGPQGVPGPPGAAGSVGPQGATGPSGASATVINTFANRPAAGVVGRLFYATDGGGAWLDDGTAWHPLLPGGIVGTAPPGALTFSGVNQGGATLSSASNGALLFTGVNDGASSPPLRGFTVAANVTATDFVEALIPSTQELNTGNSFTEIGLLMRESSSGKMISFGLQLNYSSTAFGQFTYYRYSGGDFTTRDVATGYPFPQDPNGPIFLRLKLSGGQYIGEYSRDRVAWRTVNSNAGTFTTQPSVLGLYAIGYNTQPQARIPHFLSGHL